MSDDKPRQAAINPDGTLAYTSVSAVKKFMSCPAAWFYRYKLRMPDPQGVGAAFGEKCHAETEHFLKTGENLLGDVPRAAFEAGLFPAPGKPGPYPNKMKDGSVRMLDILVEQNFGDSGFELRAEGVPFKGFIDLVNPRSLADTGLVSVVDWKFKKDIVKYGTSPEALLDPSDEDGLQMVGYAMAVHNAVKWGRFPGATHVQVSHGHIQTQKNRAGIYPTKPILAEPIPIESAPDLWLTVSPTVAAMKQVAKADSVDQVEGKKSACFKYGGCAYKAQCPHFKKPQNQGFRLEALFKTKGKENDMGILNKMNKTAAPVAPAASPAKDTEPVSLKEDTKPTLVAEFDDAGVLPPDAPPSGTAAPKSITPESAPAPAEAAPAPTSTDPISNPPAEAPKARKPRAKKTEAPAAESERAAEPALGEGPAMTIQEDTRPGFTLYVGCSPRKNKAESLVPYVNALEQKALAGFREQLKIDVDDIRLATGSDVGFGKWKAVLAALAKETPPAPGYYTVLALGMDERVDAVVAALEPVAADVVTR